MHFQNPSFLWALALLAIPILVHLFNFRKAKLVRFSNVRFLENIQRKNSSRKRLKHLLILASRLLFLAFLVMCFAQPFLPSAENGLNTDQVTIYLDNSQSMSVSDDRGITGLARAIQAVERILELYPAETKYRLITNDFDPSSNHFRAKQQVESRLIDMDHSDVWRNGSELASRIQQQKSGDIFILSDYQSSVFETFDPDKDTSSIYHIMPIYPPSSDNLIIDSVYLRRPFVVAGLRNEIIFRIRNQSPNPRAGLIIKFFLNNQQSASLSIDLEAQDIKEIPFELSSDLKSINKCKLSLEDYPATFDNEYYLTLRTAETTNVVEIKGESGISPFEMVYSDNPLFSFTSFRPGSINYEKLQQADLLIINGVDQLDGSLSSQINQLTQMNKSVVIVPGQQLNTSQYRSILGFELKKNTVNQVMNFDINDINDPFYENVFDDISENRKTPEGTFAWSWQTMEQPLLVSQTGLSFMSKLPNSGELYLFAGQINDLETDLHKNALFVPVMHRIAERSTRSNQRLSHELNNEVINIRLDSIKTDLFKLKKNEQEIVPGQRLNGLTLNMDLPKDLMSAGYYELINDDRIVDIVSFNHSKKESDLASLTLNELTITLGKVKNKEFYEFEEVDELVRTMKEKYDKTELWKYALVLSLLCLLAEGLLIRFL